MNYINKLAPIHCRTSCSDENPNNAGGEAGDLGCYRCTLIVAHRQGIQDVLTLADSVQSPITSKKLRAKAARIQVPSPESDKEATTSAKCLYPYKCECRQCADE